MNEPLLTNEQIKNWRQVLFLTIGPHALIVPKEEIQKIRDATQKKANTNDEEIPR
jgi:hypothetical protein